MKLTLLTALALTFSLSSFAADIADFRCSGKDSEKNPIEVYMDRGEFSYGTTQGDIASIVDQNSTLTIKGMGRNLMFAGGGSQSFELTKTGKKATLVVSTKTFYKKSVNTYTLNCR